MGRLLALLTNIRIGSKQLSVAIAQATLYELLHFDNRLSALLINIKLD
jgi:hypothetical protein